MTQPFSNAPSYIAQLRKAENLVAQGSLKEAAIALNHLVANGPKDPRPYILGARLAQASGNKAAQLMSARRAYELAPGWPAGSLFLASVLAFNDEPESAIKMANHSVQQATSQKTITVDHLKQAASIAQGLGQARPAYQWLLQAEALEPTNDIVQYQLGLLEVSLNTPISAITRLSHLLIARPNNPAILTARMRAYAASQDNERAIADGELILSIDPSLGDEIGLYLDICRGKTPSTLPSSVVKGFFDGAAERFDRHLVVGLHYTLPRDVGSKILELYPERECDILDLGCGTGLLGVALGPMKGVLVGVDLSEAMVAEASKHSVYDRFHLVNILDALKATPANEYHVITALDVLIYVGALEQVFHDALRILLPGGRLIFSCERAPVDVPEYKLTSAFRYAHSQGYVETQLSTAGFENILIEEKLIRFESGEPVLGFLVTAQAPEHAARVAAKASVGKTGRKSTKSAKQAPLGE